MLSPAAGGNRQEGREIFLLCDGIKCLNCQVLGNISQHSKQKVTLIAQKNLKDQEFKERFGLRI